MELKKEKRGVKSQSPNELLIYSKPKMGKTDLVSYLDDCAIIELEKGADNLDGYIYDVANLKQLDEVLTWIEKENPFKYVVIDTLSRLEEWAEIEGTLMYMNSNQGKAFNRVTLDHIKNGLAPANKKGKPYPVDHEQFKSVLELANGYGYRWLRESYFKWLTRFKALDCRKIYIAHIKDKFIENKAGEDVLGRDIDLTGKIKSITTSYVDTIGYLNRGDDGNTYLSFQAGEAVAEGSRSKHLTGQNILMGEWNKEEHKYNKTFWDKIYID